MSPKTLSPNISMRLKTSSGLRRESPAIRRLTSPWTPRTETRWPSRRRVRATWGTTGSYSFEFSLSLSRYVRTVIFTSAPRVSSGHVHSPAGEGNRQAAVAQQRIVESARLEVAAGGLPPVVAELKQLPPADGVAELIGGPRAIAAHLGLRAPALDRQMLHHVVDRLVRRHATGVQTHIQHDPDGAPEQVHEL